MSSPFLTLFRAAVSSEAPAMPVSEEQRESTQTPEA